MFKSILFSECKTKQSSLGKKKNKKLSRPQRLYCFIKEFCEIFFKNLLMPKCLIFQISLNKVEFLFGSNKKLAEFVQYTPAMAKAAQRAQGEKKIYRPSTMASKYQNIKSFGEFLEQHPEDLNYKNPEKPDSKPEAIKSRLIQSSSKAYHVLFFDEDLLKNFTIHDIFIDGTFKSRPNIRGVTQLLTIMGKINGEVRFHD